MHTYKTKCGTLIATLFILVSTIFSSSAVAEVNPYPNFVSVAKKAIPAVVSIQVQSEAKNRSFGFGGRFGSQDPSDLFGNDFWNQFFGIPYGNQENLRPQTQTAQGSGFLVSSDGYIVTNSHVVQNAGEIKVLLNDDRQFSAKIVGQDPSTDVALIKIDAKELPYITFADSDMIEVGEWVAAVGNPLGLNATLTTGIISAKSRNNLDIARIEDFIQTDTPINRGNSGGPLLNLSSEVIGMNTAIVTNMSTGGYMGIGFAIPSNIIKHVMEDILQHGSVTRGYIGVGLQNVDQDLAQAFGLSKVEGAVVASIEKGSPAEKAGLEQGDIIVKYDNHNVTSIGALRNAISLKAKGTKITLSIIRKGATLAIPVEIGVLPGQTLAKETPNNTWGFEVEEVNSDNEKGVRISKVQAGSTADWIGLKKGSLILAVNQQKINSVSEFYEALAKTSKDKPTVFLVQQGGSTRYISFKLG